MTLALCLLICGLSNSPIYGEIRDSDLMPAGAHATFTLGMYTSNWTTFDTLARLGFNMVVGPHTETDIVVARRLGLKILPSRDAFLPESVKILEALKDEPVIAAWYPYDEPDLYRVSYDSVAEARRRLHTWNARRPIFMTVWNPEAYASYAPFADWLGICPYPITFSSTDSRNRLFRVYQQARVARAVAPDTPLLVVLQCFRQAPWWMRGPAPEELRVMAYEALASGADGLLYFIWTIGGQDGRIWRLDERPDLVREIERLNREVRTLTPVLGREQTVDTRVRAVTSSEVAWRAVARDGWTWLIVANASDAHGVARFAFPSRISRRETPIRTRGVRVRTIGSRELVIDLERFGVSVIKVR